MKAARQGFTTLELLIAIAIIGILAALAVPSWTRYQQDQGLRDTTRAVSDALGQARARAIATGNNHVVYLGIGAAQDACGNPLLDTAGNPVPLLVLDDGPPGGANNCCIDLAETIFTERGRAGVNWGTTFAAARVPQDAGAGPIASGSSFTDPAGNPVSWVMFRPDGIPVGVSAACVAGQVGSGGGSIYLTNANRDYAVVMTPLGAVKVHGFDRAQGGWQN